MKYTIGLLAAMAIATQASAAEVELPSIASGISSFGAVVNGDYLYVYGGHSGKPHSYSTETTLGTFRRLNLKSPKEWEALADGPKLQGLGLVAVAGKVYRVGGMQPQNGKTEKTDTRSQSSFAVYDPTNGKWADLEPLPEARSSHDAAAVGSVIYVFGGWQMNGTTGPSTWQDYGWKIDTGKAGSKWEKVPQPFIRRALSTTAFDGKVYVVGGLTKDGKTSRDVNVFDVRTQQWSSAPAIPGEDRNGFTPATAVVAGRLCLMPIDGKIYQLSPKGDAWSAAGTVKTPRFVGRMVESPSGEAIVIGGASPAGPQASLELIKLTK